jgi:hypothetical protein
MRIFLWALPPLALLPSVNMPRDVVPGGAVLSGSSNTSGLLTSEVRTVFGESTVSKILNLVQNAGSRKFRTGILSPDSPSTTPRQWCARPCSSRSYRPSSSPTRLLPNGCTGPWCFWWLLASPPRALRGADAVLARSDVGVALIAVAKAMREQNTCGGPSGGWQVRARGLRPLVPPFYERYGERREAIQ